MFFTAIYRDFEFETFGCEFIMCTRICCLCADSIYRDLVSKFWRWRLSNSTCFRDALCSCSLKAWNAKLHLFLSVCYCVLPFHVFFLILLLFNSQELAVYPFFLWSSWDSKKEMLVSALLTSVGINTGLCFLFFILYSVLRKQPSNYEVYIPRLVAEGKSKRRSHFNLERLLPSPGWVKKAWKLSEEELLSRSGLDAVVFMRIIIFR